MDAGGGEALQDFKLDKVHARGVVTKQVKSSRPFKFEFHATRKEKKRNEETQRRRYQ